MNKETFVKVIPSMRVRTTKITSKSDKHTTIVEEIFEIDKEIIEVLERVINSCLDKFEKIDIVKTVNDLKKIIK